MAAKKAAKSKSSAKISRIRSGDRPRSPKSCGPRPLISSVTVIMPRLTSAVSMATLSTARYLAANRLSRGTGAATSTSSVPRSRSPAVRSMAG